MNYRNIYSRYSKKHPYHIVQVSPWPFFMGVGVFCLTSGFVFYMHEYVYAFVVLSLGLFISLTTIYCWCRDVVREATFEGNHTFKVRKGLRIGMILFILSEAMLFVSFFWTFFHSSLCPSVVFGCTWPPRELEFLIIDPYYIPLINTLLLVTSGLTVTVSHASLRAGNLNKALDYLFITILLGALFTLFQLGEYFNSYFDISDSVYGSIFFLITGFHGMHVLLGTIMLIVSYFRMRSVHFTREVHVGYELSIWYWHFVDVIWLFVYLFIYIWVDFNVIG
jgi:cytochrome c oxidase subunit 3